MCGLAGFIDLKRRHNKHESRRLVSEMVGEITHRGPDDSGTWVDESMGIAFGHVRLSIIDLTASGAQPMASSSGASIIAYNGEIYNAEELRTELMAIGKTFRGKSDTEVLLEACEYWGVEDAVERCIGMFAFAYWDARGRELYLVRDRIGIKPLYWGHSSDAIIFASQPASLIRHPQFDRELSPAAIGHYVRFGFFSSDKSVFKACSQVSPGTIVRIKILNNRGFNLSYEATTIRYWDIASIAERKISERTNLELEDATDQLEHLLSDAIRRRMIADVPIGAFLSGGIDSSVVVSLMQRLSNAPVKTFAVGYDNPRFDESGYAHNVARHLGTTHQEIRIQAGDIQNFLLELPRWFDEPLADPSQVPTYFVSKLAREHVTVSLSGDGGDEAFGGYRRYCRSYQLARYNSMIPEPGRQFLRVIAELTKAVNESPKKMDGKLDMRRISALHRKMDNFVEVSKLQERAHIYRWLISRWQNPEDIVIDYFDRPDDIWNGSLNGGLQDGFDEFQLIDQIRSLPDRILTKVDRASMAVSLEARVPILDHRVIEFSWQLPFKLKFHKGNSKVILKHLLSRYMPSELYERPKQGFEMPIAEWLSGPLRDWAEDLLSEKALKDSAVFHIAPIREQWKRHLAGEDRHNQLWAILMFQAWHRTWLAGNH